MTQQVTVKTGYGYSDLLLPNGGVYDEGQSATLTDEQFAGLSAGLLAKVWVGTPPTVTPAVPPTPAVVSVKGESVFVTDNAFDFTATSAQNKYVPLIFDLSRHPADAGVFFRCDLSQTAPGTATVNVRLFNMTTGQTVAGSAVSASVSQYAHAVVTSPDLRSALSAGEAIYSVEVWVSAGTGQCYSPGIVVRRS